MQFRNKRKTLELGLTAIKVLDAIQTKNQQEQQKKRNKKSDGMFWDNIYVWNWNERREETWRRLKRSADAEPDDV